jgi:hypothetical protein
MAPPKTPPAVLEGFHNLKQATIRLGIAKSEDPEDKSGQRWLRDGCNRPEDGSKGQQFPHHRMNGDQLVFSDSDLAGIAAICRNAPKRRTGNQTGRPRRKPAARKATVPPQASRKPARTAA